MPNKNDKNIAYYLNKKAIKYDFSAEAVSSDGGTLLLSALERKHHIIKDFSSLIPDYRDEDLIIHTYEKQIQQRVFMMAQGYEDCNDSDYLNQDPLMATLLDEGLCSQPTLCRLENQMNRSTVVKLCDWFINRYVAGIEQGQEEIVIDVDTTDDPTHGNQQLSLFHGHYWQWMYQELLLLDGTTGQMILPVLLPGTVYPGKRLIFVLKRLIDRIRSVHKHIKIRLRADAGFSSPALYRLAKKYHLEFCIGLASNEVLKKEIASELASVQKDYVDKGEKYQIIIPVSNYKAKSWDSVEQVYAKIESTGIGINVRFIVSNIQEQTGEQIYFDFYVKRGECCENRIKEIKNMCFSDRLSCHSYWANFFRLMLSCITYEFFRIIKELIGKTQHNKAKKWMVDNIRLFLLKIGAFVNERTRYITIRFSKAFAQQHLFRELMQLC